MKFQVNKKELKDKPKFSRFGNREEEIDKDKFRFEPKTFPKDCSYGIPNEECPKWFFN